MEYILISELYPDDAKPLLQDRADVRVHSLILSTTNSVMFSHNQYKTNSGIRAMDALT